MKWLEDEGEETKTTAFCMVWQCLSHVRDDVAAGIYDFSAGL